MTVTSSSSIQSGFTLSLVDRHGTVRYQSGAIENLLGYRPEQISGNAWFTFLHQDDATQVESQFSDLVDEGGESARWIIRFRSAGGGWRPVEVRARNLLSDPDVDGVLLSLRAVPDV